MAKEKRLIDANALIAQFDDSFKGFVMKRIIEMQPKVDAVPVVHARWNDDGRCTNCGRYMPFDCEGNAYESIYCPDCGAEMNLR